MTTQAIFDPKYNIVGVDPDTSGFVQIPGEAFQAPTTTDSYAKFVIAPNFPAGAPDHVGRYPPTPAGQYILGFAPWQLNKPEYLEANSSFEFRAANIHLTHTGSTDADFRRQIVRNEYDKYIEYTGITTAEYKDLNNQRYDSNYSTIRFYWQRMIDDGLTFPAQGLYYEVTQLEFDIQVLRNMPYRIELGTDPKADRYEVPAGPYTSPITIPVRINIPELWAKAQP